MEKYSPRGHQLKEGHYKFTVGEIPTKTKVGQGYTRYTFEFMVQPENKMVKFSFMVWDIEPLLKAFGYKPNDVGEIEWNIEDVVGKQIEADIFFEPDRRDPNKKWPRMKNITEMIPF